MESRVYSASCTCHLRIKDLEQQIESLKKQSSDLLAISEKDDKLIIKLQAEKELMRSTIEYYASNETWFCSNHDSYGDVIAYEDLEKDPPISKRIFVGGKRARETLQKIKEMTNG